MPIGSQVRTMKVIDVRHLNISGYKIFTHIILCMLETGRRTDRSTGSKVGTMKVINMRHNDV